MKIALMMENSQAGKNAIILEQLHSVATPLNHEVFNVGMSDENDHHLTYTHLGIMVTNNTEALRADDERSSEILGCIPAGRW